MFEIPDLKVKDWRSTEESPLPDRGMNDQVFELLESFQGDSLSIGALMHGLKDLDGAMHTDDTIDAAEWEVARAAIRKVMGKAPAPGRGRALKTAFDEAVAAHKTEQS